ncbi:MAG: hypothetical protein AAF694_06840 [Bacteroidota bacterium]
MKKQVKRLSLEQMKAKVKNADKQKLSKLTSGVRGGNDGGDSWYWI